MDYQVSARKHRPGTFDDVIGQAHVVQTLINSVNTKRIAHAYLFSGTRGVGKTTVARILAKALNCEQGPTGTPCAACIACQEISQGTSVDVIEIDGASNTSVDDVREIRENIKFTPFRGQYRVYIIDEVHMLSNSAFNALLKTLEEPPSHVVFIFATTEIHKIPATILSRCQHYNFRRIAHAEIIRRLRQVAQQDGLTVEDRSLMALARASEGSMRDALSLLDQAIAFGGSKIIHADLEALLGAVPQELLRGMIQAIVNQDSPAALRVVSDLLDQGHELRAYCGDVVEYLRNLLVASVVTAHTELHGLIEASEEDLLHLSGEARSLLPEQLQELFAVFTQAEDALRFSAHPRFVLETAAIRATRLLRRPEATSDPGTRRHEKQESLKPALQPEKKLEPPSRPDTLGQRPSKPVAAGQPAAENVRTALVGVARSASVADTAEGQQPALSPSIHPSVRLDWEAFQDAVTAGHPNIAPFLEMGRLVGIDENHVTIGFAKHASSARSMLEKPDNLAALAALTERVSGRAVRLRIVELTEADGGGKTIAQIRAAKEEEQRLVLFEQARANPVVKEALEIFGADLADVRDMSHRKEGGHEKSVR
ncbi:MAG TPA: DNA polymerase III subunit gamma/tau [Nitrospiraceae bacterium]|jgi:DNA polymerase-3 subunit gamma/tau